MPAYILQEMLNIVGGEPQNGLDTVPLLPEDLQAESAEDELIGLLDGQRT